MALQSYQAANTGRLLMEEFFDARPAYGYGTQRVLTAAGNPLDTDASILRQGTLYHQEEQYDLALVAFRAYFSGSPVDPDPLHLQLAATAAMSAGAYTEAADFVAELSAASADKHWWQSLLALRQEDLVAAKAHLQAIAERKDHNYPVADLLRLLP